jgi:hypothetical protein
MIWLRPKAISFLTLITIGFLHTTALSAPKDLANYEILPGGLTDIRTGAYVEGSQRNGGIQPDYFIDLNAEPLKSLLAQASKIGESKLKYWDKVGTVVELVREDFFKYTDYSNPYYRRLLKKYRQKKEDIPLHEYLVCKAGVCREHALALHFALKAAGIPNFHAYAKIYRASNYNNFEITEDHAFTVLKHLGVEWVVDAYYWGFNGFRLQDLMTWEGITEKSPYAPIADPGPGTRRIIEINSFPRIYNPKFRQCSAVFH